MINYNAKIYNGYYIPGASSKHRVFISFYHHDDQRYKDYIDAHFGNFMTNESVMDGEYNPDNSDEYIKRLIREDKITSSSVIVVLVGPNTRHRKHVDWEIYAGLSSKINGRAGLAGIVLPEVPLTSSCNVDSAYLPARLNDNVESGYAKLYTWNYAIQYFIPIINTAFEDRLKLANKADNSRPQMRINTGH